MKFGIFYELQLPRPWKRKATSTGSTRTRSTRSSWPTGWATTMPGRSSTTSSRNIPTRRRPKSFLAAASQRTKHIRLGHGIMQLTTNHPARVAEKVASLDLLSNGRCEFGMGESASITELEPFGVDHGRTSARSSRRPCAAIMPMFKDGRSEHRRQVLQHARCATCCRSRCRSRTRRCGSPARSSRRIAKCGEWGMGALGFQFVSADAAHAWVHAYYNAFAKRQKKLADYQTNPNIALVSFFMCAKTDEEARARADGDTFFQFALRFYGRARSASGRPPARSTCGTSTRSGRRPIRKRTQRRCAAA